MKVLSSPSFTRMTLLLSQWYCAGSGNSRPFSMAITVESGIGVVRIEFLAKAVGKGHFTHTSAKPILSK